MLYVMALDPLKRKIMQSLVHFGGEKIYTDVNENSDRKYIRMCEEKALQLLADAIKTIAIINGSNICMLVLCLYAFCVKNEIQLVIPVLFPFTDLESTCGLIINALNQMLVGFMGFMGLIGIEVTTCILKDSLSIMNTGISYSIDVMTEEIQQSSMQLCVDHHFRNIIIQVQDFDR